LFEGGEIPKLQVPLRQIQFTKNKSKYTLQGIKISSSVIGQDVISNILNQSDSKERRKEYTSNSRSRMQKQIYGEKMLKINKDLPPPPIAPNLRNSFLQELKEDESY
jgi:hypothetical protein